MGQKLLLKLQQLSSQRAKIIIFTTKLYYESCYMNCRAWRNVIYVCVLDRVSGGDSTQSDFPSLQQIEQLTLPLMVTVNIDRSGIVHVANTLRERVTSTSAPRHRQSAKTHGITSLPNIFLPTSASKDWEAMSAMAFYGDDERRQIRQEVNY